MGRALCGLRGFSCVHPLLSLPQLIAERFPFLRHHLLSMWLGCLLGILSNTQGPLNGATMINAAATLQMQLEHYKNHENGLHTFAPAGVCPCCPPCVPPWFSQACPRPGMEYAYPSLALKCRGRQQYDAACVVRTKISGSHSAACAPSPGVSAHAARDHKWWQALC